MGQTRHRENLLLPTLYIPRTMTKQDWRDRSYSFASYKQPLTTPKRKHQGMNISIWIYEGVVYDWEYSIYISIHNSAQHETTQIPKKTLHTSFTRLDFGFC